MWRWVVILVLLVGCTTGDDEAASPATDSAPAATTPATTTPDSTTTSTEPSTTAASTAEPSVAQVCEWLPGLPLPLRRDAVRGSGLDLATECPDEVAAYEALEGLWQQSQEMSSRNGGLGNEAFVFQGSNDNCDVESGGVRNTIFPTVRMAVTTHQYVGAEETSLFGGFVSPPVDFADALSFDVPQRVDASANGCGFSAAAFLADDTDLTDTVDGSIESYQLPATDGDDLAEVLRVLHELEDQLEPAMLGAVHDVRSADYFNLVENRIVPQPIMFKELCNATVDGSMAGVVYLIDNDGEAQITFSALRRSPLDGRWRFMAYAVGERAADDCSVFNPASPVIPSERY